MAIAFSTSTPSISIGGSSGTTASFTAPANSILVAYLGGETNPTFTLSNSGTALTWTKRADNPGAATSNPVSQAWTAPNVGSQSITVSATASFPGAWGMVVYAFTGVDMANPVAYTFANRTATTAGVAWTPALWTATIADTWAVGGWANYSAGTNTYSDTSTTYAVGGSVNGAGIRKSAASPVGSVVSSITTVAANSVSGAFIALKPDSLSVLPGAITSEEAWGTASLGLSLATTAIASAEAWGTAALGLNIAPSSIASEEAWGTAVIDAGLRPSSIPSAEAWGTPAIIRQQPITLAGIASGETWGTASLQIGYPQDIALEGIASGEVWGDGLAVELLSQYVLVNPSIQETPAAWHRLFARYGLHRGITIMKDANGLWSSVRYPAQTEIEEALVTYMGGHRHKLTEAEAQELILAGYGPYIELDLIE